MFNRNNHSFVICAYKENPHLEMTIQSLLNQTIKSKVFISTSTPNDHIKGLCEKYGLELFVNPSPKNAGADFVGEKDMLDKIKNENWFDFDVVVATPDMMPEVGKIGNILGPRNLMPNPKTGTVTTKVGAIVEDLKKGMVTYKNDKFGNIHTVIGKVSFDEKKLAENLSYVITTISKAKPQTVKGTFIENIAISTTMGPGIKLDKNSFDI